MGFSANQGLEELFADRARVPHILCAFQFTRDNERSLGTRGIGFEFALRLHPYLNPVLDVAS